MLYAEYPDEPTAKLFLIGDAATCVRDGQVVSEGFYNLRLMLGRVVNSGGEIGACGTCNARRAALQSEIERLVDAIARFGASDAVAERIRSAEAELKMRCLVASKVREALLDLSSKLADGASRDRAREALRQVLGDVRIEQDGRLHSPRSGPAWRS